MLNGRNTHPLSKRRPNFADLPCDTALPVCGIFLDIPYLIQPVGKLHNHHPQVGYHGKKHLADGIGVLFTDTVELYVGELCRRIENIRCGCAELTAQLFFRHLKRAVFAVKEGTHNTFGVHFELRKAMRHTERMRGVMGDGFFAIRCQPLRVGTGRISMKRRILRAVGGLRALFKQ